MPQEVNPRFGGEQELPTIIAIHTILEPNVNHYEGLEFIIGSVINVNFRAMASGCQTGNCPTGTGGRKGISKRFTQIFFVLKYSFEVTKNEVSNRFSVRLALSRSNA